MRVYDYEKLRALPFEDLLREAGETDAAASGRTHLASCPKHPGSDHAKLDARRNRVHCFLDKTDVSTIDWVMEADGCTLDEACALLSRRFGIPISDDGPPRPPLVKGEEATYWSRIATGALTTEAATYLADTRGFPRAFSVDLAHRRLVASNPHCAARLSDESFTRAEAIAFPWWRLDHDGDRDFAREALDVDYPCAMWQRFLEPIDDPGAAKPIKHRFRGKTERAFWSAAPGLRALANAKTLFITEGAMKGAAIECALRAWDLRAQIEALSKPAGDGESDDNRRGRLDTARRCIRAILGSRQRVVPVKTPPLPGERSWWHAQVLALPSVTGGPTLLDLLRRLLSFRTVAYPQRPSIRLAFDIDDAGRDVARRLYRELNAELFDTLTVEPPRKDWDEALKRDGAGVVRRCLGEELPTPVLRRGARLVSGFDWRHEGGWQLAAIQEKEQKNGEVKTIRTLVADFVARTARRIQPTDWTGNAKGRPIVAVTVCGRSESNGVYGLREHYLAESSFNNPEKWQGVGRVHAPALFGHYLSEAKDMAEDVTKVVPIIGLTVVPGKPNEFQLVGGDIRRKINATYTFPVETVYDHVDWRGEWGGTPDIAKARHDARTIHAAFARMFKRPIGPLAMYWIAGTLLKVVTRNYPHCQIVGQRGSGKSTLATLLQTTFGLQQADLQTWETPHRPRQFLANHTLPFLVDEASRINIRHKAAAVHLLNQAFDIGAKSLPHGREAFPLFWTASAYLTGQDWLTDSALESKMLAVALRELRHDGDVEPDAARLPAFPWRAWGEWLCAHLTRDDAAATIAEYGRRLDGIVPVGLGSRPRFIACWSRLLLARDYLWRFLGVTVGDLDALPAGDARQPVPRTDDLPARPMGAELEGLLEIMLAHAEQLARAGLESVEMLTAYAGIVASEPGRHPVHVVDRNELMPNQDDAGAWIVPAAVTATLERAGRSFALSGPRAFLNALVADGMLGAPPAPDGDDDGAWVGGAWTRNKKTGAVTPVRRKKPMPGGAMMHAYLVPAALLERHDIEFATTART